METQDPAATAEPTAGVPSLPPRTTPTWEMELLVSGATVFGLMQLPPHLDRALFWLFNAATPDVSQLVMPVWIYCKFSLLTLIATFVLHLAMRGYWVALVGLHSVYPGGIRWEQLRKRSGPVFVESRRRQLGDMDQVVERADNRASLVFAVGFGLAGMMVVPALLVSTGIVIAWLWNAFGLESGLPLFPVLIGLFCLVFLPFMAIMWWDKARGHTLVPGSRAERWLHRLFHVYSGAGFGGGSNTIMSLYGSHAGNYRAVGVMIAMMVVMCFIAVAQSIGPRLGWTLGDDAFLPDDRQYIANTLMPEHYDSRRGSGVMLSPPPFIADPVVRGPYLRLFVPYSPQRHTNALHRTCPDLVEDAGEWPEKDAFGDDTAGYVAALTARRDAETVLERARLDCFARVHAITLDGAPIEITFDAAEDPKSGLRGLQAMIPMENIASGRHELTVMPAPRERYADKDPKEPQRPWRILFWR